MSKPSKVLIIGSGPIIIGQAAEFDYAGTQACKAMREEGVTSVLINSNPATIMTDEGIADIVYIEPLTVEMISPHYRNAIFTTQGADEIRLRAKLGLLSRIMGLRMKVDLVLEGMALVLESMALVEVVQAAARDGRTTTGTPWKRPIPTCSSSFPRTMLWNAAPGN